MNNEGVGTRFSLNQEESYLCEYKSSGNVHYPMWHGKGKREIHVAGLKKNQGSELNFLSSQS